MRPSRCRLAVPLLALAALATVLCTDTATQRASASPHDHGPGLALRSGATLAPAKILDLGSAPADLSRIVGTLDGAERRRRTNAKVTYQLQSEVLFPKDSARLCDVARSRIVVIAREIKRQAPTRVRVAGFTDNVGSAAYGDLLSHHRAAAVRDVLADVLSGEAVTFDTRGFGERHPAASNATESGRKKNRRVEISFG
ncbi:OmpA family protein [Streptomyces sp. NPDC029554]|uniref:OmpA family protein n=1 Tax=Streptomyces sp. NPDC029554 TaxID=3155126 RepID=UPI0033EC1A02